MNLENMLPPPIKVVKKKLSLVDELNVGIKAAEAKSYPVLTNLDDTSSNGQTPLIKARKLVY